jgi:hypothetical protein
MTTQLLAELLKNREHIVKEKSLCTLHLQYLLLGFILCYGHGKIIYFTQNKMQAPEW